MKRYIFLIFLVSMCSLGYGDGDWHFEILNNTGKGISISSAGSDNVNSFGLSANGKDYSSSITLSSGYACLMFFNLETCDPWIQGIDIVNSDKTGTLHHVEFSFNHNSPNKHKILLSIAPAPSDIYEITDSVTTGDIYASFAHFKDGLNIDEKGLLIIDTL